MSATHLGAIAERNNNSFNLLRLFAASAVVISHAVYIVHGEAVPEPMIVSTGYPLGAHAVNLFFALSGFMIAASWHNNPDQLSYVAARALRLYPALLSSSLIVFILGGIVTTAALSDYYSLSAAIPYFVTILVKLTGTATLPGLFEQLPGAGKVNGPIWTLKYEAACYIALPCALIAGNRLIGLKPVTILGLIAVTLCAGLIMTSSHYTEASKIDHFSRMGFAFFAGAFAWHLRSRIPLSWNLFAVLLGAAWLLTATGLPFYRPAQILVTFYGAAMLASINYGWLSRVTDRTDLSYGIYVFGWPIQQAVLLTGLGTTVATNAGASLLIAAVFAYVSWHLVEKRALKMRRFFKAGTRAPNAAVSGP